MSITLVSSITCCVNRHITFSCYILTLMAVCSYPRDGSQSPLMVHQHVFQDIQRLDPRARYIVKFSGSQKVSKYRHVDVFSGKDTEYSFEKKEGTVQYSPKPLVKLPQLKCRVLTRISRLHRIPEQGCRESPSLVCRG
jgi:hypothetical protein